MKLLIEIPDKVVDDIVCSLPRDNPRAAWTQQEKRTMLREWLYKVALREASSLPGRDYLDDYV